MEAVSSTQASPPIQQAMEFNEHLLCPIGQDQIKTAMIDECGHTFEDMNIRGWFEKCRAEQRPITCPISGTRISEKLTPNLAFQSVLRLEFKNVVCTLIQSVTTLQKQVGDLTKEIKEMRKEMAQEKEDRQALLSTGFLTDVFIAFGCKSKEGVIEDNREKNKVFP